MTETTRKYPQDFINKVICGDCLTIMPEIPAKSIDMILCDLPYGTTACKWDTIIPFEPLWKEYKRIIKDNGAIVLTASQPFTSALVMSNPDMFRYEWIWEKQKGSNFANANKMPMRVHENVVVFYKHLPTYNPQKTNTDSSYYRKGGVRNSPTKVMGEKSPAGHYLTDGIRNGRFPRSIQKITSEGMDKGSHHPTQKPVALFEYLIKTYTNEGDLVLDNCAGSGTTGVACKKTNRNFILIEKEEKYFKIAEDRLRQGLLI
jgi:site-specific DNA-methyltransferase (adenine-specific)